MWSDNILCLLTDKRGTAFINLLSQTCGMEVFKSEVSETEFIGFFSSLPFSSKHLVSKFPFRVGSKETERNIQGSFILLKSHNLLNYFPRAFFKYGFISQNI